MFELTDPPVEKRSTGSDESESSGNTDVAVRLLSVRKGRTIAARSILSATGRSRIEPAIESIHPVFGGAGKGGVAGITADAESTAVFLSLSLQAETTDRMPVSSCNTRLKVIDDNL